MSILNLKSSKMENKSSKMETKEINIAEILKDCPKGIYLYSPILGCVRFEKVEDATIIVSCGFCEHIFRWNGRFHINNEGECMLFPSKDQRDWSKFRKIPILPPFNIHRQENKCCTYWSVDSFVKVKEATEYLSGIDDCMWNSGNYFNTREQAEYAAEKVKELLLSLRKEA